MLPILLLLACFTPQQSDDPEPFAGRGQMIPGWWQNQAFCDELGISADLRETLAGTLNSMQISYQMAQTRLNDARREQTKMMLDPSVDLQTLAAFNDTKVSAQSKIMQDLNFEARTFVRARLNKEQIEKIAASKPRFFSARWFKVSSTPVREGKVILIPKKP